MAFNEFELAAAEKTMAAYLDKNRPPPEVRPQLDLGYRITNQSTVIFEIRPSWWNPREKIEEQVAKTSFVRTSQTWKVYWQRADLKWHGYTPVPQVDSLTAFLKLVEDHEYCCFFG